MSPSCEFQWEIYLTEDTNHDKWAGHSISYTTACAPSEDSGQPVHPHNLIRVFTVRLKTHWILGYLKSALQRLLIRLCECADDLGLRRAHMHEGNDVSGLIWAHSKKALREIESQFNLYPAVHDNRSLCKQRRSRSDGFWSDQDLHCLSFSLWIWTKTLYDVIWLADR